MPLRMDPRAIPRKSSEPTMTLRSCIRAIATHLPSRVVTNAELAAEFPEWNPDQIRGKTGIAQRHIASASECSSDLAFEAASKLLNANIARDSVDLLVLCTQSPDYFLPTTACVLQERLGLPRSCAAFDMNLGCSGWVYGLGIVKGMLESGQGRRALLVTAETYSKFLHPRDRSVRTIFGDAAAATLVELADDQALSTETSLIGPFIYGTDGRGAENLIVRSGGFRTPRSQETSR